MRMLVGGRVPLIGHSWCEGTRGARPTQRAGETSTKPKQSMEALSGAMRRPGREERRRKREERRERRERRDLDEEAEDAACEDEDTEAGEGEPRGDPDGGEHEDVVERVANR